MVTVGCLLANGVTTSINLCQILPSPMRTAFLVVPIVSAPVMLMRLTPPSAFCVVTTVAPEDLIALPAPSINAAAMMEPYQLLMYDDLPQYFSHCSR